MATPDDKHDDRVRGLVAVGVMVAVMWVLEIVDQLFGAGFDRYGIEPRDTDGLGGIAAAPFLHAGFDHLIGNTIPFLVLGAVIALNGLVRVLATTAIIMLVAGLGTWLVAPAGTVHVGASGVVFGYAAYLIARGIFSRSMLQLAVGAIVLLIYSTTLLSALVPTPGISWQSHLFGAIGGVLAAWLLDRRRAADGSRSGGVPALELR
jgi:membrane associated rhomboid family serine protease